MKEYRFRALSIDGVWEYGLLSISKGLSGQPPAGHYISNKAGMPWAYHVRPETVGLDIGIDDENSRTIFEGDIVKGFIEDWDAYHDCSVFYHFESVIEYRNQSFSVLRNVPGLSEKCWVALKTPNESEKEWLEVVGNIHEKALIVQ